MPIPATVAARGHIPCVDSVDVEYVDAGGDRVVLPLQTSFQTRFDQTAAVRLPQSFKGQRNFPGMWWFASTRSHIAFSSWLARDQLIEFDFDPAVIAVAFRPMTLRWTGCGVAGQHTPDYPVGVDDTF